MDGSNTLNRLEISVIRRPDASHTLVQTCDWLLGPLQLLSAGFFEQVGLLHNLLGLEVSDANGLLSAVDVVALDDGVFVRSWGDSDLDLGVGLCKGREGVLEEGPRTRRA